MNQVNNNSPQRTYNLHLRKNNTPINIENENGIESSENDESQNDENMFDIFNEIDKNVKEVTDNINRTDKRQKMYQMKNLENEKRLRQNMRNYSKTDEKFYSQNSNFFHNLSQFQYGSPYRIYKPSFDISKTIHNNYVNNAPNNNINNKFYSSNNFKGKEFFKISNYNQNEENKIQEYLINQNENRNCIKKGFIKRAKSAANSMHNKSKKNTFFKQRNG